MTHRFERTRFTCSEIGEGMIVMWSKVPSFSWDLGRLRYIEKKKQNGWNILQGVSKQWLWSPIALVFKAATIPHVSCGAAHSVRVAVGFSRVNSHKEELSMMAFRAVLCTGNMTMRDMTFHIFQMFFLILFGPAKFMNLSFLSLENSWISLPRLLLLSVSNHLWLKSYTC